MGFNDRYSQWIGTNNHGQYNSIMTDFFGFSVNTTDDFVLKNSFGGSTYLKLEEDGKIVKKDSPLGSYYTEKTGTHTLEMERENKPSPKDKEFENRFIAAMGKDFEPNAWVWEPIYVPSSASFIYARKQKKSLWPKIIAILLMTAILAACIWFLIPAVAAVTNGDATNIINWLIILGTALGLLVAFPIAHEVGAFFRSTPDLEKCSRETQIEYGQKLFDAIDEKLPYNAEAAKVLKEYAIYLKRAHPETPVTLGTYESRKKHEQKQNNERSIVWAAEKKKNWTYGAISLVLLLSILGALLLVLYQKADILWASVPLLQETLGKLEGTNPAFLLLILGGLFTLSAVAIWAALYFEIDTSTVLGKIFIGVCIFGAIMLMLFCVMIQHLGAIWVYLPAAVLVFLLAHKIVLMDD